MAELTLIIPTRDMNDTLERAIDSVAIQDVDVEVIVVDDGSSPPVNLPDTLMTPMIKILRHDFSQGAAAARNAGIKAAKTDWLCFLDADDYLLPKTLDTRLNFAKQISASNTELVLAKNLFACAWIEQDEVGRLAKMRQPNPTRNPDDFFTGCWWSPGSAMMCHKSVFSRSALIFDEALPRLEDFDFSIRLGKTGGALFVQPLNGVVIKPSNKVTYETLADAAWQISKKHLESGEISGVHAQSIKAYLHLELFKFALLERKFLKACYHLLFSYWHVPRLSRHLSPGWIIRPFKRDPR